MVDVMMWDQNIEDGENKLYNVLIAYANYDIEVGYVQGMNYIVALLLLYIEDEQKVFWSFV